MCYNISAYNEENNSLNSSIKYFFSKIILLMVFINAAILLSCNDLDRLQIFSLVKHSLLSLSNSATLL